MDAGGEKRYYDLTSICSLCVVRIRPNGGVHLLSYLSMLVIS